jgi:uncharacterized protein (TIGR02246 family)
MTMKRTNPSTQRCWRTLTAVAIVSILSVISVSAWARPEEPSGNTEEAAVRALVDRISDGWQKADPDGVAAVFAETGAMVAGEGSHRNGRPAIAQFMRQVFTGMPKGMRLTTRFMSLRFLRPDVALLQTEGGFLMPGETQLPAERLGIQSFVAIKHGRTWQVALFQNTRVQARAYEAK